MCGCSSSRTMLGLDPFKRVGRQLEKKISGSVTKSNNRSNSKNSNNRGTAGEKG